MKEDPSEHLYIHYRTFLLNTSDSSENMSKKHANFHIFIKKKYI